METIFQKLSLEKKILIVHFLKEQGIITIRIALKKTGKTYLKNKYPAEAEKLIENKTGKYHFIGTIKGVFNDVLLVNRLNDPLEDDFILPIELIDNIRVVVKKN